MVPLSQYQPQTESESYIYSEWKKTVAKCNNLKTLVHELQDRVDPLMSREKQELSENVVTLALEKKQ